MSDSNLLHRARRRLLVGAASAFAVISVAFAADPGLPFTEQFLDTNERDAAVTTADWGIASPGVLQLGSEVPLENMAISGSVMGGGLDGDPETRGIALGDFDGDGDLDAAVANESSQVNLVYENTGGSFSTAPTDLGTAAARSRSIKAGDLDLDGDLDLVVGNFQGINVWHENDGTGSFSDAINITALTGRTWPIELADVDGDGDLDIIEGQDDDRVNRLFRSQVADTRSNTFVAENIGTDTFSTRAMVVGDVNGDGAPDLVTGDHGANNHIYYGDGDGGFQDGVEVQPAQAWNTFALALADLNGDGALDLVEGTQRDQNDLNGETRIYLNNGAGGFLAPTLLTGSNTLHTTVSLLTLDFDKDGDIDILEGNNGSWDDDNDGGTPNVAQPNRLFLNNGSGAFALATEQVIAADNEQTYAMAAGDIDGDGILDFVTGNQTGDNASYTLTGNASANPPTVQQSSVAQSTRVDDGTQGSIRFARVIVDPTDIDVPEHAQLDFFLTNDDGATWVPAPLDRPIEFQSVRVGPVKWRAELSTASPLQSQRPTLREVTIATNEAFPSFNGPGTFAGTQGQDIVPVQVDFSDADGDRLSYSVAGLPVGSGLSINANTGVISGQVTASDAAAAPVDLTVTAFDGVRFDSGTITFTLGGAGNQQPIVAVPIPDQGASVGVAFNLDVSANFSDPEGANLSHSATGLPASITMNAAGVASGTPAANDVGTYNVTVTATDPGGLFATDTFVLTVASGNQAPQVDTPIGNQTVTEGVAVNINISGNFSDPDGDMLNFGAAGAPPSLTLSSAGVVTGTPTAADVGSYNVVVTATDPGGLFVTDTFTLTVNAATPPPPPPPPPSGGGGSASLLDLVVSVALLIGFGLIRSRRSMVARLS